MIAVGQTYRSKSNHALVVMVAREGSQKTFVAPLNEFGDMTPMRVEYCAKDFSERFEVVA